MVVTTLAFIVVVVIVVVTFIMVVIVVVIAIVVVIVIVTFFFVRFPTDEFLRFRCPVRMTVRMLADTVPMAVRVMAGTTVSSP